MPSDFATHTNSLEIESHMHKIIRNCNIPYIDECMHIYTDIFPPVVICTTAYILYFLETKTLREKKVVPHYC